MHNRFVRAVRSARPRVYVAAVSGAPQEMRAAPWRYVAAMVMILLASSCSGDGRGVSSPSSPSALGPTWPVADAAQIAAPPMLPTQPDGPTVEVPSKIDHSCGSDVTAALQSFLTRAADNSTVAFAKDGCYRVDTTLTIDKHHRLDIEGNGATLRAGTVGDRDRRHLVVSSSDDIIIRDLVVSGSNDRAGATADAYDPNLAFQHAFVLNGVHRVLLEHVAAGQLHGDFVYVGGNNGSPSSDVTVARSTFDGSGRQGISITDADRVLVVDNDIANAARSLIDLEPNTANQEARNVRISGNRTGAAVNFWLANKGAGDNIGPVEIDGNTMKQSTGGLLFAFGKAAPGRGPWTVRGNQLIANNAVHDEGSVGAFFLVNCHDVSITGNQVTFPPGGVMPAIELRASKDIHIAGNDFTGASQEIMADADTKGVSTSS